jgi:hypothetical protein
MLYDFAENECEPEALAGSARGGGPARKFTGIGFLDRPVPPKRQPGLLPATPSSLLLRILAGLILAGNTVTLFFLVFAHH